MSLPQLYVLVEKEPVYGSEFGYSATPIGVYLNRADAEAHRKVKRDEAEGKSYWSGGGNAYTVEGPIPFYPVGSRP